VAEAQPYRFYADAEFLLWRIRNPNLPSLVSTAPVGVVSVNQQDTFVSPNDAAQSDKTHTFLIPVSIVNTPGVPEANSIDYGEHAGVRATIGFWLDPEMDCGLELSGFALKKKDQNFRVTTANVNDQTVLDTGLANRTFILPAAGAGTGGTTATQLINSQPIV